MDFLKHDKNLKSLKRSTLSDCLPLAGAALSRIGKHGTRNELVRHYQSTACLYPIHPPTTGPVVFDDVRGTETMCGECSVGG